MKAGTKRAIVAVGANLPVDNQLPVDTVHAAVADFKSQNLNVANASRIFMTPAFPPGSGPDYANSVIAVDVAEQMSPEQLLSALHSIEKRFGRERLARWAGRTLDLDLLAMEGAVLPDRDTFLHWHELAPDRQQSETPDRLILPHPRMDQRAFVLVPMAEVAPDWRHPVLGLTVMQMLERLPEADRAAVRPL